MLSDLIYRRQQTNLQISQQCSSDLNNFHTNGSISFVLQALLISPPLIWSSGVSYVNVSEDIISPSLVTLESPSWFQAWPCQQSCPLPQMCTLHATVRTRRHWFPATCQIQILSTTCMLSLLVSSLPRALASRSSAFSSFSPKIHLGNHWNIKPHSPATSLKSPIWRVFGRTMASGGKQQFPPQKQGTQPGKEHVMDPNLQFKNPDYKPSNKLQVSSHIIQLS